MAEEGVSTHMSVTAQWAIELLASPRTKRYLTITQKAQIRLDRKAIQQAARTDGKWVIQTNDDTLTPEDEHDLASPLTPQSLDHTHARCV